MVNVSSVRYSHWNIERAALLLRRGESLSRSNGYVRESERSKGCVLGGSPGVRTSTPSSSFFSAIGAAEVSVLLLPGAFSHGGFYIRNHDVFVCFYIGRAQ
ncbi:hypothetical protein TSMEX_009479 [Taenia solium]|eukprot:TsM_000388200 transcript=TsM_000388200 gene=TsM_000388200